MTSPAPGQVRFAHPWTDPNTGLAYAPGQLATFSLDLTKRLLFNGLAAYVDAGAQPVTDPGPVDDVELSLALAGYEKKVNRGGASPGFVVSLAPDGQTLQLTQAMDGGGATPVAGATTLTQGTVRLAGDLAGTADLPTVPGLASKLNLEQVQDAVAAMIVAGSNVTLLYDDAQGTLTIGSTATGGTASATDPEIVRDTMATALIAGTRMTVTVDDLANTITLATTATTNSTDAQLRDRATHTGSQSLDTTTDSATRLAMTAAERTKLSGVAASATVNRPDAELLDRKNHTGVPTVPDWQPNTPYVKNALVLRSGAIQVAKTDLVATASFDQASWFMQGTIAAPAKITGLAVGARSSTTIALTWSPVPGATSYVMEVSPTDVTAWTASQPVADASGTVTGLTASTNYQFRVTASNGAGPGLPSDVLLSSTLAAAAPPPASGSVLPARVVEGYFPGYTQAMRLRDTHPNYNLIKYSFAIGVVGDPGAVNLGYAGGVNTVATLAADIAEKDAAGKVCILSIGGAEDMGSSVGYQLSTTAHVDRFVATVQSCITQLGGPTKIKGIDWDLEHEQNFTAAAVISASQQLKSIYGPNFIIAAAPYGLANSGTTHPLDSGGEIPLVQKYRDIITGLGAQFDLVAIQFYNNGDNTIAAVKRTASDFIASTGIPDSKFIFGFMIAPLHAPTNGGVTHQFVTDLWNSWRADGRESRGIMIWEIDLDRQVSPPYGFATGPGQVVLDTAGGGSAVPVSVYSQTFGTDVGTWRAKTNAGTPTRDTVRSAAGSLRWTAPAAGGTEVEGPSTPFAVTAGHVHTVKAAVSNGDSVARNFYVGVLYFDAAGAFITSASGLSGSIAPGTTFTAVPTLVQTAPALAAQARVFVGTGDLVTAGAAFFTQAITVTRP